jgi:hypothetical protein
MQPALHLERKDLLLLIPATFLALAGLGPEDPWILGPCLALSWLSFLAICWFHNGPSKWRILVAVGITVVLFLIGSRRLHLVLAIPPKVSQGREMPEGLLPGKKLTRELRKVTQSTQKQKTQTLAPSEPFPTSPAPKDGPKVVINNAPGGFAVSGGTINNPTVNNSTLILIQPPDSEPIISVKLLHDNEPQGDLYRTEFLLTIVTRSIIPNLYLKVSATTIKSMEAIPQRTGGSMFGHSGTRDGYAFTNLQGAYGSYIVSSTSTKPEKFTVEYDPQYQ